MIQILDLILKGVLAAKMLSAGMLAGSYFVGQALWYRYTSEVTNPYQDALIVKDLIVTWYEQSALVRILKYDRIEVIIF